MTEAEPERLYEKVRRYLSAVRVRSNLLACLHGALTSLAVGLALMALAIVAEEVAHLSTGGRAALFWAVLVLGGAGVLALAGPPLLRLAGILRDEGDLETAGRVGRAYPGVRDRLVNMLQLYSERSQSAPYYSAELIDAAIEDLRGDVEALDVSTVTGAGALTGRVKLLGGMLALCGLAALLFPAAAERLSRYDRAYAYTPLVQLVVEPGNARAVKGESLDITVRVVGDAPAFLLFASRPQGQTDFEERRVEPVEPQKFLVRLRSLAVTTEYFACVNDVRSDTFHVLVTERPLVRTVQLTLHYPPYSGLGTRELPDDVGDVTALRGTIVGVRLLTGRPVVSAELAFSDSTRVSLRVEGTAVRGRFTLAKNLTYHICLRDSAGVSNSDPITYALSVTPDAYPAAAILVPGTDLDVTEASSLDILVKITDDFGFTRLRLAEKLVQSRYEQPATEFTYREITLPELTRPDTAVSYQWPLTELSLVPEDVVQYYMEVFDNDAVSGPKSGVSATYSVRLPSLEEVFADVDRAHEQRRDELENSLEAAREARKDLEQLRQELTKEQQKLDWQTQRRAENLLKNYGELQKKLDAVEQRIGDMADAMEKRQLLSPETLEKYRELQRVMEGMNSPELAEALRRMQQALQALSPEAMRQALQTMEFSEEAFRKSIERTLALVKRIQIEQRMEELVKRAEGMAKAQEAVRDQTQRATRDDPGGVEELARRQAGIEQEREGLEKSLDDLAGKMEEFAAEMPIQDLQKAKHTIGESGLEQDLERAADHLKRGEFDQASDAQDSAVRKTKAFAEQMEETRRALQRAQMQQVANELGGVLRDLLELSQRQEELKRQSRTVDQNSLTLRENAQRQMDVQHDLSSVTSRLGKLAQKTFSVSPEMGKSIGDALRSMGESVQLLDQRAGAAAAEKQQSAMASLNQAAQQVQGALSALRQGGGQGMAGLLQRLQRLTGMQQGINDGTRGLSQQQAAEMARLAGEQGIVRKSLEQLAREASLQGEASRLLGDLNKIAQEMREVQVDLAQQNVNPETMKRQEHILSRLIDSQRSLEERDFEKRRVAESGRTLARTRPAPVDLSGEEMKNKLRRDLLKALEGGYAPEYEALIRKYFEVLEQ